MKRSSTSIIDETGDDQNDGGMRFLRRQAASEYLKSKWGIERAPATLAKLAVIGGGPPFRRHGRVPLYAPADLDTWAEQTLGPLVTSTSEWRLIPND